MNEDYANYLIDYVLLNWNDEVVNENGVNTSAISFKDFLKNNVEEIA